MEKSLGNLWHTKLLIAPPTRWLLRKVLRTPCDATASERRLRDGTKTQQHAKGTIMQFEALKHPFQQTESFERGTSGTELLHSSRYAWNFVPLFQAPDGQYFQTSFSFRCLNSARLLARSRRHALRRCLPTSWSKKCTVVVLKKKEVTLPRKKRKIFLYLAGRDSA